MKRFVLSVAYGVFLALPPLAVAEAGAFIRAFYPDDVPVPVAIVNPRTVVTPASAVLPVQNTVAMPTTAGVVAATVESPAVVTLTKYTAVNDGFLFRHRAYPNKLLHWSEPLGHWLFRTDRIGAGWAFTTEAWDLDPPRPPFRLPEPVETN